MMEMYRCDDVREGGDDKDGSNGDDNYKMINMEMMDDDGD